MASGGAKKELGIYESGVASGLYSATIEAQLPALAYCDSVTLFYCCKMAADNIWSTPLADILESPLQEMAGFLGQCQTLLQSPEQVRYVGRKKVNEERPGKKTW